MIRRLLAYGARRSHDVRVQTALATVYGLISIFGHAKTALIMVALVRTAKKKGAQRARTSPKV